MRTKLKTITALTIAMLTMSFFVTAWNTSSVHAAGACWIVDSLARPGYNFLSLAAALTISSGVSSGDHIFVRGGHSETLATNLDIKLNNLWIIGPLPSTGVATIDVHGYTINITGVEVFIWGLYIKDFGISVQPAIEIDDGMASNPNCDIQSNVIYGPGFGPGSIGIQILNSANALIALNTIGAWDTGVQITGTTSNFNRVKLNTLFNLTTGIWLSNASGAPSQNWIYWNNFNVWSPTPLEDDVGNPQDYFDSSTDTTVSALVTIPLGNYYSAGPTNPVPPNNKWSDGFPLLAPISHITGDVNLDGIVNILDFILLANTFGHLPGQYAYDPRTDLNLDAVIDILDAIIMSNHYGQHYP